MNKRESWEVREDEEHENSIVNDSGLNDDERTRGQDHYMTTVYSSRSARDVTVTRYG
jgi:hypothetical protein